MRKTCQNLLIFVFIGALLGCESKNSYNIAGDEAIKDLSSRIVSLESDMTTIQGELVQVKKVLEDPDIDTELRTSIRKEIHEGEKHVKDIEQWISFLKIRRKKRYNSLVDRKGDKNLKKDAEAEVKAYFVDKKLKPIDKKWKNRYRTAIEL